jgi:hypothetical protein
MSFKLRVERDTISGCGERVHSLLGLVVGKTAMDVQATVQDNIRMHDLIDTGFMLNSVTARPTGADLEWEVFVGAYYAIYHEFGTAFLSATPFFIPAFRAHEMSFEEAVRQAIVMGTT